MFLQYFGRKKIFFYLFISILCAKMSSVYKPQLRLRQKKSVWDCITFTPFVCFPDKVILTRNNLRRLEYGTGGTAAGSMSTSTAPPSPSIHPSQPKLNKFKKIWMKDRWTTKRNFFLSLPIIAQLYLSRTHIFSKNILHTTHTPSALSFWYFDPFVTSFEAYYEACEKNFA